MSARKRALWPGLFHLEGLRHFLFICRNIIRRARIRLSSYVSAIFHRSTKRAIPMRHKQANERQPRSTDRVDPRPVVVTLSACLRAHPHAWPLSARSGPCFFTPLLFVLGRSIAFLGPTVCTAPAFIPVRVASLYTLPARSTLGFRSFRGARRVLSTTTPRRADAGHRRSAQCPLCARSCH